MSRKTANLWLLSSFSILTMFACTARAQVTIPGGGAILPAMDYAGPKVLHYRIPSRPSEEYTANCSFFIPKCLPGFEYYEASSGRGQEAFSTDNPAPFAVTPGVVLPTYVAYAGNDGFLGGPLGQTINGYTYVNLPGIPGITADYPLRAPQDGALIQIPMLGVGIAIAGFGGNPAVQANGTPRFTDNDLCGMFSGLIISYNNIANPLPGLVGPIHIYYSEVGGSSFIFTNHLRAVCTAAGQPESNSNFPAAGLAAAPTRTFVSLFAGGPIPNNFTAEITDVALATALAGTVTKQGGGIVKRPGDPAGISFIATDFTGISGAGAANRIVAARREDGFINSRAIIDAGLLGRTSTGVAAFLTPTILNIDTALSHPGAGSTDVAPPGGAAAVNPLNWVPSIPTVTAGYPVVGYTTWELAQCYAAPAVALGMVSFLNAHFLNSLAYVATISAHGFTLPSTAFRSAMIRAFLTPNSPLAISAAGSAGACAQVSGR